MTIHDPDVVFTDVGLAVLGTGLAWMLKRRAAPGLLTSGGIVILLGLSVAALAGAVFHAIFTTGTTTLAGYLVWLPVPLAIAVVSSTLVYLAFRQVLPFAGESVVRLGVVMYGLAFIGSTVLVDESFGMIVRFYAPALLLFLVTAMIQRAKGQAGWGLLAGSFAVSAMAAAVQQAKLGIHPDYFDHNAVYHVFQGIALVLLYRGVRQAAAPFAA